MSDLHAHVPLPVPLFADPDRRLRLLAATPALEQIFRAYAGRSHAPGVACGVILDSDLVHCHAFGVRRVDTQAPVDADTVFRIASMTKSFVALAILMLRDEGHIHLDALAADYAPELAGLRYPDGDAPAITVRHLLTMSAGLPQDDPWADRQMYRTDADLTALYAAGCHFSNPPGIVYEYSNLGYMALGRIITRVTGVPATDYIRQAILQPLGMTATVWNAGEVPADRLALGYRRLDDGRQGEPLLPSGGDVAAFAGLFTSVRDLARWVALFLAAWPPRDEPESGLVRRSTLREMQQVERMVPLAIPPADLGRATNLRAGGYGFGLTARHNGAWWDVGHGGGLPGFGSHMRWAPDHGIGVVALANVTYANMHEACRDALDHLINAATLPRRVAPPSPALSVARDGVLRLLDAWDDDLADRLFADNFFLDTPRPQRRKELEQLHRKHGRLQPDGALEPENWLRGRWRMRGERGWCSVWISLAPGLPTRIQALEIDSVLPPSEAMQNAAQRLATLTARPTRRGLARLFSAAADRDALWDRVRLANILCGPCTVGDVLGGDSAKHAVFRFAGPKSAADVELTLAPDGTKLSDAVFRWPAAH
jgi:CubicO group peptidase (beta-lactamase class C family)